MGLSGPEAVLGGNWSVGRAQEVEAGAVSMPLQEVTAMEAGESGKALQKSRPPCLCSELRKLTLKLPTLNYVSSVLSLSRFLHLALQQLRDTALLSDL